MSKVIKSLHVYFLVLIMSVPSLSLADDNDRGGPPSREVRSSIFGEGQGYLSRLIFGPRRRNQDTAPARTTLQIGGSGVATISLDSLRGGYVSYDIVESLEFHHPILNSPWFFKKVHNFLNTYGVKTLTRTQLRNGYNSVYDEVAVPVRELRQSLTLIPEILNQKGDEIAASILADLKEALKLNNSELDPSQIADLVLETDMTVEQIKELRAFLIENTLNEDELIDALHMSSYKASHIIATELKRQTGLINLSGNKLPTYTGMAAGATATFGAWSTFSILSYLENLTRFGLDWGESFVYEGSWREELTYLGREFKLDHSYTFQRDDIRRTLEELQELGLDASSLVDRSSNLTVAVPYIELGATAVAALTLGYFAPKLWAQSKPYLSLLRNRFLNSYLRVLRMEGLLSPTVVSQHRDQVMGLVSQVSSTSMGDINRLDFEEASDIRAMESELTSDTPIAVSSEGFATQVMILGHEQMKTGTDVLSHFTKDMALWFSISKFYKTELNRLLRTSGERDFARTREVVEAYQQKLNDLSGRIEAYERIVSVINSSVENHITFLKGLLEDDSYLEYVEIRDDGLSDYEVRARRTIEDRISDLTAFHAGTLTIIRLSLGNAYNANYAEQRDLQIIMRVTSSSALAITEAQTRELNQTLLDLVQRKIGDIVSKPDGVSEETTVEDAVLIDDEIGTCSSILGS